MRPGGRWCSSENSLTLDILLLPRDAAGGGLHCRSARLSSRKGEIVCRFAGVAGAPRKTRLRSIDKETARRAGCCCGKETRAFARVMCWRLHLYFVAGFAILFFKNALQNNYFYFAVTIFLLKGRVCRFAGVASAPRKTRLRSAFFSYRETRKHSL